MMGFYERLDIEPKINAATYYTAIGGSLMPEEVLDAMKEAGKSFVSIHELQLKAGNRIADLTKNEGAYITCGAAAGIALCILACRTEGDLGKIQHIIDNKAPESEVIMHVGHRISYDPAIRLAGSNIVTIGNIFQTYEWELEAAINSKTSAIFYVAGSHLAGPVLPLEAVIKIGKANNIPVVVDASAQLPPLSNLWHFTKDLGAELAIFSGGKTLCGPQASGLIVGQTKWIEAVRANGSPNQGLGRAFKVGKEEIAGLTVAVELFVAADHDANFKQWNATIDFWMKELSDVSNITLIRESINEAGQPIPRLQILLPSNSALKVVDALRKQKPSIEVVQNYKNKIWLSADALKNDEDKLVVSGLKKALTNLN
jgi:L-seryl-tRNA(Ser) seleniumtransferase